MELSSHAQGRWYAILSAAGIGSQYLRNKKGPCPGCGGVDRFRWDDKDGNGTFYCGGGGDPLAGDGFGLIKHVFECDFPTAARMVEEALGGAQGKMPWRPPPKPKPKNSDHALSIWRRANPGNTVSHDAVVADHPYSKLKRITHACGAARTTVTGRVVGKDADCLVLPLRSPGGVFRGVECIGLPHWDDEKKKHVTPKQTFGSKGCLILGNTLDKPLPVYIVEGWADAVSTWRMEGNVCVVAVFGPLERQEFYANLFEQKNPDRQYTIIEEITA